jgi:hypothetical protein
MGPQLNATIKSSQILEVIQISDTVTKKLNLKNHFVLGAIYD